MEPIRTISFKQEYSYEEIMAIQCPIHHEYLITNGDFTKRACPNYACDLLVSLYRANGDVSFEYKGKEYWYSSDMLWVDTIHEWKPLFEYPGIDIKLLRILDNIEKLMLL